MTDLSIMIEPLSWSQWQHVTLLVENLGYHGLYCGDHLTTVEAEDQDLFDVVVALTYAAHQTKRIRFGSLVSPVSFRDPVLFTRQAAALADLSEGRMTLGLGTGWNEHEHDAWGYHLGDRATRWTRLEEGLEVTTRLVHGDAPVTYEGRFFQLRGAALRHQSLRLGALPILVGGNSRTRTLPLVARYADIWNAQDLTPAQFREHSALLDDLVQAAGRQPANIRRTLLTRVEFGRDLAELDQRMSWRHTHPDYAGRPLDEVLKAQWEGEGSLAGLPDEVTAQIMELTEAGVEELILLFEADDSAGIEAFAQSILPRVVMR